MITDDDREFLRSFEQCSLGAKCWNHAAHIRMAWLVLESSSSFDEALSRIKTGIKRFNSTNNSIGYHETITVAFATIIDSRRRPGDCFYTFSQSNPDLFTKGCLDAFYNPESLKTNQAKIGFVAPDRNPLPVRVREISNNLVGGIKLLDRELET